MHFLKVLTYRISSMSHDAGYKSIHVWHTLADKVDPPFYFFSKIKPSVLCHLFNHYLTNWIKLVHFYAPWRESIYPLPCLSFRQPVLPSCRLSAIILSWEYLEKYWRNFIKISHSDRDHWVEMQYSRIITKFFNCLF
jgi:hypothetical protein